MSDGEIVRFPEGTPPALFQEERDADLEQHDDILEGRVLNLRAEIPAAVAAVGEHGSYVAAGAMVVSRRVWRSRSASLYTAMIEGAAAVGNHELALEWEARRAAMRRDRHDRRFDWIELLGKITLSLPRLGAITAGVLMVLGILLAVATRDYRNALDPILVVAEAVRLTFAFIAIAWLPLLALTLAAALAGLYLVGRTSAHAGQIPWLAHHYAGDHEGDPITPSVVVTAFRDLGYAQLRKAIADMGDAGASMLSIITPAGCGVEVDVTLPSGTSTQEVQDRHRKLAENLGRHAHEVFITIAPKPRTVRLFIADHGSLDEPIGPSPLVTDLNIRADYYTGRAPWGETLRGEPATVSLFQQHLLITGKSNQGKTASLRALMLWLAFDPSVEFWIADLKGVGDWSMFEGLATVLIEGPTDEECMAATHMVEDGVEEMNRRLVALKASGSGEGVTRDMARTAGSGFHPLELVIDEAQKGIMCPVEGPDGRPYGGKKKDARLFNGIRAIQNQGRAVNVTVKLGTQDPTDQNLPAMIRDPAHLRLALYLATESQAKMALGDAPVQQGAAPHRLRDGLDRGTVIAHGPGIEVPRGEPAVTIRTHYIDGKQAAEVAERAKKRRARVITSGGHVEIEAQRSFLDDLYTAVLDMPGDHRVKLADIPALLREVAPGFPAYQRLTGVEVGRRLEDYGIRWTNAQGYHRVAVHEVRDGLERLASGQVR